MVMTVHSSSTRFRCFTRILLLAITTLVTPLESHAAPSAPHTIHFSRDILPILSDKCFYCHGPDEKHRKAHLRLDLESTAKSPGKNGAAIVPGQSNESLLVQRILSSQPDEVMPPPEAHKELTPTQKELIQRWIAEGAHWGKHWAFSPLSRPTLPGIHHHPIDDLVASKLTRENLTFSPEADPRTLLRRLSLALTGLPPTEEEMDAWLKDTSNVAWEKQVDRLLASSAYGERMAWDWLEASRYSDTNGYQGDNTRTMWPWRDWVVKAFNSNMPYDQFTLWQLAGDLLPGATDEQRLATAFLRNHPINGEGGRIPAENRVDYLMDMTETTATVWLGLTMNCCRCHDHKFDPLTQRDYYSLFAFFNQTPVDGSGGDPQTPPHLITPSTPSKARLAIIEDALTTKINALRLHQKESTSARRSWESHLLAQTSPSPSTFWTSFRPRSAKAKSTQLNILEDHSILASGPTPANDDFEIQIAPGAGTWTGLRIDALRHSTLKHESTSRAESGNFVLTTVRVERQDDGNTTPRSIPLSALGASFEQGDLKLAGVLDDDPNTGWGVWNGRVVDRSHAAVLRFELPVETSTNTLLTIHLRHESKNAQHILGRVRLSLTATASPTFSTLDPEVLHALTVPEQDRTELQKQNIGLAWDEASETSIVLRREINQLATEKRETLASAPKVMIMADQPALRETHVLDHGLYNKPLQKVAANTPASLPPLPPNSTTNRLNLAQWIVSPDNPLTARVTVNRFWQNFFGVGLVKTSEDFGVQAEFPPHIELLDALAADFRDSGWNVKQLIRQIVTSRTFKQSSRITPALLERDPANRLLARGPRFRMPSWMIRDQALAASGLLKPMDGGPPVKPWQPDGVWEEATFGNVKYSRSKGDDLHRRSLYTFWRRIVGPTLFFDTGSRLVCNVKPLRTNTPLHALATLNDITYLEAARTFAENSAAIPQPAERISTLMQRLLGRPASAAELEVLLQGLERNRTQFIQAPHKAQELLQEGERPPHPAARTPDLAAWTLTALTLLNLDETLNQE